MPSLPPLTLAVGQELFGFVVRQITPLADLFMVAYELEHSRSGARLLHFHCEDNENLFSINFPTPPADDTGLPHIMEHAVLSGSGRFPVRDPFFEMYKMSMATFINAMTGADCTYYPVCSNVKADLFNLADVYFDAVFHPLLTEETFKREGHHLLPATPEQPTADLTINGIVYNEMKAAFAKPEARLGRIAFRRLFPDTCYGKESGGDPEAIPDLTYEQFLDFHRHWYHPSNARFVFYGDIPTADYLGFLAERLGTFERRPVRPEFASQPRWSTPVELVEAYDVGDEEAAEKTFLQMNWLVPGGLDVELAIHMEILSLVLVGDDAAPLKKAIVDSGLGQDLLSSGVMQVGDQGMFCIGIRGSEAERQAAFRELVLGELARLVRQGIAPALVESACQRYTYSIREIKPHQPLHVAEQALAAWIHEADPLLFMRQAAVLDDCRRRYAADPNLLVDLLRQHLLENPHRLDIAMVPDPLWQKRIDAELAARLKIRRAALSDADMLTLAAQAEELERLAGTPNPPEALATLPQLSRNDLPPRPIHIPHVVDRLATGNTFIRNDVFANGVNYLELHVDLDGLPAELWLQLPRYLETVKKLGASGHNYEEMARRVSAATGSFSCFNSFVGHAVDPTCSRKGIVFSLKALDDQVEAALDVLHDKLFAPEPNDPGRFRDVATQGFSRRQAGLINNGPNTGATQLCAGLTEVGFLQEKSDGLSQFHELRNLSKQFAQHFEAVVEVVGKLAGLVRNRRRFTIGFTGGDRAAELVRQRLEGWFAAMPDQPFAPVPVGFQPFAGVPRLGLAGPMPVAHCVQIVPAIHNSHPDSPLVSLAMALLRVDYMVSELRFKGNAYGANCSYNGRTITLSTYADPHIKRTLEVYAGLADYVRQVPWTEVELLRGILCTAKNAIRPIRPEDATGATLTSHLIGETEAVVDQRYQTLLAATPERVKRVILDIFADGFAKAPVAIVSSREKLEAANRELGPQSLEIQDLLA